MKFREGLQMDVQGVVIETLFFGAAIISSILFWKEAKQDAIAQGDESTGATAKNFVKKILD